MRAEHPAAFVDAYVNVALLARRYYRALDDGEREAWIDTFDESGVLVLMGRAPIVGRAGLIQYWSSRPRRPGRRKHAVTDVDVLSTDEGHIEATTEILTLDLTTGETLAIGSTDELLRLDHRGRWRYARKSIRLAYRHARL